MAETSIQWTATPRSDGTLAPGYTFNPWIGCFKISDACKFCYAAVDTYARVSASRGLPLWGKDAHRHVTGDDNWKKPRRWNRDALAAGERRKVFCASLADVFEARDDLDSHRERLWALIDETRALDWLLLTKRPEEIMRRIPERWRTGLPANVWVGATVENQKMADERVPHLLSVPARVRFLSVEPQLESIDLDKPHCQYCYPHGTDEIAACDDGTPWCTQCDSEASYGWWLDPCASENQPGIKWVIVGGESGPEARPFDVDAARNLLRQCRAAGCAVFMKQLGAKPIVGLTTTGNFRTHNGKRQFEMVGERLVLRDRAGGDPSEWPEDLRIREFPEVTT